MPNDPVMDAIQSAKGALSRANDFKKSVEATAPSPKPAASKAPAAPKPAPKAAPSTGDELKEKAKNVNTYAQGLKSYHKGGTVTETGPAILKKGEEVIPAEKADKVKDMMKHAEGAISKDEKHHGKPKHGMKHTHIEHHGDGSHTVRHTPHAEQDANGMSKQPEDISYAAPDMDALQDGMEKHLGEPNDGEAEAEAAPAPAAGEGEAAA